MSSQVFISGEFNLNSNDHLDKAECIDREILIAGTSVRFQISVMNEYARLSHIVPLARTVCDRLLDTFVLSSDENNGYISCRKGCATCCSYLVPLSMPEVFRLRSELSLMPADDRIPILKSCVHAARKLLKKKIVNPNIFGVDKFKRISEWYAGFNIQCPFLSHGECMIYEKRPLACREYYVTSPSVQCQSSRPDDPRIVRLPISIAEVLGEFAAKLEGTEPDAVILPLALIGTDEITRRSRQTWPVTPMIYLFLDVLEQTVASKLKSVTVPYGL